MRTFKEKKKNRLRQLVKWGYATQAQANKIWLDYLRMLKRSFS